MSAPKLLAGPKQWYHTPSNLTLLWIAISSPLVIWDMGYVFARPHSMPGGKWHSPYWSPYALYAAVDYVYGFPAWEAGDGFNAAQSTMNAIEVAMNLWYLWIVYKYGKSTGEAGYGAPSPEKVGWLGATRRVSGRKGAQALAIGLSAAVMTLSKTVLYWLNEYFSGFRYIGHNDLWTLFKLWILPNGFWLVLPMYMVYAFTADIVEGLTIASSAGETKKVE